jgi:AcrR family transcriptional regulator
MPKETARPASAKEEAILAAALELFVARGFYGTAVPAVAERAGVAAGTIYHYFASKEALVNALYRRWKQEIASFVFTQFPVTASTREQVSAMWRYMARFALDHPAAFAFLEFHEHRSYLDAESLALENQLKDFGAAFVAKAQARGELRPMNTVLMMELVFGAFGGMMRAHYDGRVTLDDAAIADAEAACWAAIVAPP